VAVTLFGDDIVILLHSSAFARLKMHNRSNDIHVLTIVIVIVIVIGLWPFKIITLCYNSTLLYVDMLIQKNKRHKQYS
jgi:hypothetical protein